MSSPVDPAEYRRIIGLFATGVTVVATELNGEPQAMTANAVTSVSLDPLLVLVCINNQLPMVEYIRQAGVFTINILCDDQEPLSNYFAHLWHEPTPPDYRFLSSDAGPCLEGCMATIGCELYAIYDGGDHRIVVGRVVALDRCVEASRALLFFGGRYASLARVSPETKG